MLKIFKAEMRPGNKLSAGLHELSPSLSEEQGQKTWNEPGQGRIKRFDVCAVVAKALAWRQYYGSLF